MQTRALQIIGNMDDGQCEMKHEVVNYILILRGISVTLGMGLLCYFHSLKDKQQKETCISTKRCQYWRKVKKI